MNYQDQLTLLSDILKNQQQTGFGTVDEFSQISRLTEQLQNNNQLDSNMRQTIASIASYCETGSCLGDSSEINQWIQFIEDIT